MPNLPSWGYGGFPMTSGMLSQQTLGPQPTLVNAPLPPVRPQLVNAPLPPSRSAMLGDPGAPPPGAANAIGNAMGGPYGWLASLFSGGQGAGQGMSGMLAERSSGGGRS